MPPRYILIANPGTKRCEAYRRELFAFWEARGAEADLVVVPWGDVIPCDGNLDDLDTFDRAAVVRMESPGKDDHVTRLLLEAGARDDPAEPHRDWSSLCIPKGLLMRPGLLNRGLRRIVSGLRESFDTRPHLRPTACPLAVAEMFDKTHTSRKLAAADVPVPEMLDDPWDIYQELGTAGGERRYGWERVYLKLNTGSSATGIIVFQANDPEFRGATTLMEINSQFFNSRLVRTLKGPPLQRAAWFILSEGAIVQRGIPMAQIDGQNFDVRVVCLYGKPVATIFRLSSNPMTNLHLGGRRGDFTRCRSAIPTRDWLDALDNCAEAADCFASAIVGVDLVFERGFRQHSILEVNAFGDFFPGWTDTTGRSIHALEIEATAKHFG